MDSETVAGKSVGLTASEIVRWEPKTGAREVVKIRGRWVYVKKCRRAEDVGGIALPEKSRDDHVISLVLAVGDGVGKPHEPTDREIEAGMSYGFESELAPYQKIMTPDDHTWGIKRSPYGKDEFFIHEDIVIAVVEEAECQISKGPMLTPV